MSMNEETHILMGLESLYKWTLVSEVCATSQHQQNQIRKKHLLRLRHHQSRNKETLSNQTPNMNQLQILRIFLLSILILHQCESNPLNSQCVDESFCTYNLQDYYSQLVNLPNRINERSIATWSYVENIDLNRVPQVIHEASCHNTHSCRGLDSNFGLETIPVSLRMPVLRKNPNCFPTSSYSLEFELITVACICAISRHS